MDYPRHAISELHLGKFTDSFELQSLNVNFKTGICANSVLPQVTMHWVKELEIAKRIDDLVTSQSITGRRDFTHYDMFDTMIASALQKLPTRVHFRKKLVSKSDVLRKTTDSYQGDKLIAHIIYEHFGAIGAFEAAHCLSRIVTFRISMQDGTKLN